MSTAAPVQESASNIRLRGPATSRWLRRTLVLTSLVWTAAAVLPQALGLSDAWRAFGTGLVIPGAGLLYAMPPLDHTFATEVVVGHAVVLWAEVALASAAVRRGRGLLVAGAVAPLVAIAVVAVPTFVVVAGHIAAFIGVLAAASWAFAFRSVARSDYVTLPAIVLFAAAVSAALTQVHGDMPGPMTWVWWGAPVVAVGLSAFGLIRERVRHGAARRLGIERENYLAGRRGSARTNPAPLDHRLGTPEVTEADVDQLRLLRYLMSIAAQPLDNWDGFDAEGAGPLQQYRYQLNAIGWALAMYGYSHTPALRGPLHRAQLDVLTRMQDQAVWGYWYHQNLLGNWDFRARRADPIDVPQNIMFTGYLNLQLAMFGQATGDRRFDTPGSLTFSWSPTEEFTYDHPAINDIVIRNFGGELGLWPCEPLPVGRRRRHGLVFPYCNAVSAAGVAILDALVGTSHAADISRRFQRGLDSEFTAADGDIVSFIASGLGFTARAFRGPATTASVAAFVAPLLPDLAWRAWEILLREWLTTDRFRHLGTGGSESPIVADWGSQAATNAESFAAAMLLAQECGESDWCAELWTAATEQLRFGEDARQPGVWSFDAASLHANGMLGLGGLGRTYALTDMMSRPRPPQWDAGPRIFDMPHPNILVAKAVSDGYGLDAVLHPGLGPGRFALVLDQLTPRGQYLIHGAVEREVTADAAGKARIAIELRTRSTIAVRPVPHGPAIHRSA
ncbi:hypothetical protein ACIBG0_36000 [Nocardia sp. NPDC050630]|uniref:linalool dehydratase/isomerase domain-containing protein n=1 Tax=Nocardia sp. NPDC050630 TaxID=3364321 RepID=UPI0037BAF5B8